MGRAVRISLMAGNLLTFGLLALGLALVFYPQPSLLLALASWVLLVIGSHCPAHYITGRACGVKFTHYVIAPSALAKSNLPIAKLAEALPVLPGIRIEKSSLRGVSCGCLLATYASGALASMIIPWAPAIAVGLTGRGDWLVLAALQTANLVFTAYFSPKWGDLARAIRAWRKCKERA